MSNKREENVLIKYGNWEVTEDVLIGKVGYDYFIYPERLWETTDYKGHNLWFWLIHLSEKTWLNKENFKDLNNAFFFAQDYFRKFKPDNTLDVSTYQTLNIQKKKIEVFDEVRKHTKVDPKTGIVVDTGLHKFHELESKITLI